MTDKVNETKLQAALIGAGLGTFNFHNDGVDYPIHVADLPDVSIIRLARYGTRACNDAVNSTAARSDKAKTAICKEWIEKLLAGELGTGGGRSRISPFQRALRETVKTYLLSAGIDNKEATVLCKEPQKGFRLYLIKKGVSKDKLEAAGEKHWPAVVAKAKAFVELEDFDID